MKNCFALHRNYINRKFFAAIRFVLSFLVPVRRVLHFVKLKKNHYVQLSKTEKVIFSRGI